MALEQNFNEVHADYVTMEHDSSIVYDENQDGGSAQVGKAVMMVAQGEVGLVATNGKVFGKLISVEDDGFCTVQDEGYAELPTDGTPIVYTGAAGANGLIGGATAGTVKAGSGEAVTAIKAGSVTNTVIAKIR